MPNQYDDVAAGFGDEWSRFDWSEANETESAAIFQTYFHIVPWHSIPPKAVAFDAGCGTGRWAKYVSRRVGTLHCIDASAAALEVARRNLVDAPNCRFHLASIDTMPLSDNSADFGYSLGVLHHIPDTAAGISACVSKLKRGAPFLIYLYYALDNRPWWFRWIWRISNWARILISRLPHSLRYAVTQVLAITIYWPFARIAALLERMGMDIATFPLSSYRHRSLYVLRNDALDRFGTRVERRFTRDQIERMLRDAGMEQVVFSESPPYWCVVSVKR
jgi:SAM-dependent methyltransferase